MSKFLKEPYAVRHESESHKERNYPTRNITPGLVYGIREQEPGAESKGAKRRNRDKNNMEAFQRHYCITILSLKLEIGRNMSPIKKTIVRSRTAKISFFSEIKCMK